MATSPTYATEHTLEAGRSAVSWPAIFAGAVAAAALSILLLTLGSGLGFASTSFNSGEGATLGGLSVWAAIWMIVIQWASAGVGGYLTGRLRTKWVDVRGDEILFRDTSHGFLAWALATVLTAVVVASGASAVVAGGVRAASSMVSGAAQGVAMGASSATAQSGGLGDPTGYFVDTLFRPTTPAPEAADAGDVRTEAGRILVTSLRNGSLAPADRAYLAQLAAARTGISQAEAEKRVDDMVAQATTQAKAAEAEAREAAETARKGAAKLAFFTAFSLLIGAFIASAAGGLGGRSRDDW